MSDPHSKQYFSYCLDDGFVFHNTLEEAEQYTRDDIKAGCVDGEWDEDIEIVCCGRITSIATQTNRIDRPPEAALDEEGCDEYGFCWWGGCDFTCNYELKPVDGTDLATAIESLRIALADAIRRPMGVIPASADGLLTQSELDAAEARRAGGGK